GGRMHAQRRIAHARARIRAHAARAGRTAGPFDLVLGGRRCAETLEPALEPGAGPCDQLEVLGGVLEREPCTRIPERVERRGGKRHAVVVCGGRLDAARERERLAPTRRIGEALPPSVRAAPARLARPAEALEERMHGAEAVTAKQLMELLRVQRGRGAGPAAEPLDPPRGDDQRLVREAAPDAVEVVAEAAREAR